MRRDIHPYVHLLYVRTLVGVPAYVHPYLYRGCTPYAPLFEGVET
jgi:hypothetical protein